jgi:isoquinoline 1-oxidoreductase subunit beta
MQKKFSRRKFLKTTAISSGGLMIGMLFPGILVRAADVDDCLFFQPNPFIRIDTKGMVTLFVPKQEMGQAVNTSLPTIIAEELDCDFRAIKTEIAPFGTLKPGQHNVGASQSLVSMWEPLRKAGAVAKAMLISAAAKRWQMPENHCAADNGTIVNTITLDSFTYGELVCDAAKMPIPETVALKNFKDFKLVGKSRQRSNTKEITTGKAVFGLDIKLPGMLYAVVERAPVLGGKPVTIDDTEAYKTPGVVKIFSIAGTGAPMHVRAGVVVVASNTWAAIKARKLLKVKWDEGTRNHDSSDALFRTFKTKAKETPAEIIFSKGDVNTVSAAPANSFTAEYSAPFLAHATMEPVNFIAQVKGDQCEVWGGLQLPDDALNRISADCNFKKENIRINLAMMGGGFGRRLRCDFAVEAVQVAMQIDKPVMVIWERTDDIRYEAYRPANYHRLSASWDENGNLKAWKHHLLTTSVAAMLNRPPAGTETGGGFDRTFWYDIANVQTAYTPVDININRSWLRGVSHVVNVFASESFVDEVAVKLKKDPLAFRLSLLENAPVIDIRYGGTTRIQDPKRLMGALKTAAEKIGWTKKRKKNHFVGIAGFAYINTSGYCAHAIEIEIVRPKEFRIVKVVAAVDSGIAVNPDGLKNQMEGAVAFALGQVLKSEITIENSRVVQHGFSDYEILRFKEMPPVEVHIIPSTENPGGVGEIAIPAIAPALCNALAAAGYRPRNLPIRKEGFKLII